MTGPVGELRRFLDAALVTPVPQLRTEAPGVLRRRRIVAGLTFLVGAAVLSWTLRITPGDPAFYWASAVLATVWVVGAFASGPLHRGRAHTRSGRHDGAAIVQSLALATLLIALFLAGALLVAQVPWLSSSVERLLDHARLGAPGSVALLTVVNGVAEELYFRGALFAAIPVGHAVAVTTALYVLTTVTTGIPLLVVAAAFLGTITGLQRRVTGGVLGPAVTHVTWSLAMLLLLPHALAIGA